jgi:hypothetical protein
MKITLIVCFWTIDEDNIFYVGNYTFDIQLEYFFS